MNEATEIDRTNYVERATPIVSAFIPKRAAFAKSTMEME